MKNLKNISQLFEAKEDAAFFDVQFTLGHYVRAKKISQAEADAILDKVKKNRIDIEDLKDLLSATGHADAIIKDVVRAGKNEKVVVNEKEGRDDWKTIDDERSVLDYCWRSAGKWETIGVVAVENKKMGYWCAYIGHGNGSDEKADVLEIADWGGKLQEAEARAFFPDIELKYKAG